ncbi:MAG: DUF11 domain-containing protein [Granulosicoccus sp.]|nr:DUF11 domain-containing protein [Granulosicoccus sp.]
MKSLYFTLGKVGRTLLALTLTGTLLVCSSNALAATKAGEQIKNLATVTYEDSAGNQYTALSNEAIVTVAQVYSASIGTDVDKPAAPGQTVYLPFLLTNTGNGIDTYDLSVIDDITGSVSLAVGAGNITIYNDLNGNGEPESGEPVINSVTIDGSALNDGNPLTNNYANLIVAVQVPTTATTGQTAGVTLTAEAQQGTGSAVSGSVTDTTAGGGRDTLDGTNESLITITEDAVLVVTKNHTHDTVANEITYTIEVKNTGGRAANNVVIWDGLPANTTLESFSVSGILGGNGDTVASAANLDETALPEVPDVNSVPFSIDLNADGDALDSSETDIGIDINTDNDTADSAVPGVYAVDVKLDPSISVTLTYTVSYLPASLGAGYVIQNVAHVTADLNEDGIPEPVTSSLLVQDSVAQDYAVTITDTAAGGSAGVNDGGDDDNTPNNDQLVDSIASGATAYFNTTVTNGGTGTDRIELSVATGNFPALTVFSFWDMTDPLNPVQLLDTNSSAGPDTGPLVAGTTKVIQVRAQLPAGVSGDDAGSEFQATVTATSAGAPAAPGVSSTVDISLTTIIASAADIHNVDNGSIGADEDPLGAPDYATIHSYTGTIGTTVDIELYIDNETSTPDAYQLNVGDSWDGTTLGGLPSGWSVAFYVGDGAGGTVGSPITGTAAIPGNTLDYPIIARVSIPSSVTQALADYTFDNDNDGTAETLSTGGDTDGDYPFFFQIVSTSSGATDITLAAIDVDPSHSLTLSPAGNTQVEAGGTATYSHNLVQNGNVTEVLEMASANSEAGWTNTVRIDTTGNGVQDTALVNLLAGPPPVATVTITVLQANGTPVSIVVTDTNGDGNPELAIPPGSNIPLAVDVFAPSSAPINTTDSLIIAATGPDASASVIDITTVIDSLVRLEKTVAVDADCNGSADAPVSFLASQTIAPGECAIWRVVANNQGTTDALKVVVSDSMANFTTYQTGSLEMCQGLSCAPQPVSDTVGDDLAEVTGNTIKYYLGAGAVAGTGGTLVSGEFATMQFRVMID